MPDLHGMDGQYRELLSSYTVYTNYKNNKTRNISNFGLRIADCGFIQSDNLSDN
jgi:hypothetical protein